MSLHYFAIDGNYGDAEDLVFADTTLWTEEDWQSLDNARDAERPQLARLITTYRQTAEGAK